MFSLDYENRSSLFKVELGGDVHHSNSGLPRPHFRRGSWEGIGERKVKKISSIFKIHNKNCLGFNLSQVDNTQNSPGSLSASRLLA